MYEWTFTRYDFLNGFKVPKELQPDVSGGALKLRCATGPGQIEDPHVKEISMIYSGASLFIESPSGLGIPMEDGVTVSICLRNLSPETDGKAVLHLRDGSLRHAYFHMQPYQTARQWTKADFPPEKGRVADRVGLAPFTMGRCGDSEISSISVMIGAPEKGALHERFAPHAPTVIMPVVSNASLLNAFKILDKSYYDDFSIGGVSEPFFSPGGQYGRCWWQLDNSLATAGAKWANQALCEKIILGLCQAQEQNPDGRIDLYAWSTIRGTAGDISSLPKFLQTAYDVAIRSTDDAFISSTYQAMKGYLDWWLSPVKLDGESGLVTGVFEESFPADNWQPQRYAQVDLNAEVAAGCLFVSRLAGMRGNLFDERLYQQAFFKLKAAVNACMWDEERGAYYAYDVMEKRRCKRLVCSTFDVLRSGIAPPDRAKRLVSLLTSPDVFGWEEFPVTSVAKTDPEFVMYEAEQYMGLAWFGDIWTLRNEAIVSGLSDAGYYDLAARLAWVTICLANENYCEFFSARDGKGYGVNEYAWTASQYIQLLIERIFGISCDVMQRRMVIMPLIPHALQNRPLRLDNLTLPGQESGRLTLEIYKNSSEATIHFEMTGTDSFDEVYLAMPGAKEASSRSPATRFSQWLGFPCVLARPDRGAQALFIF